MKCFIISESLLEKNARKLMLDFYDHILREYNLITPDDDLKKQKKYWHDNLVEEYIKFLKIDKIFQKIDEEGNETFSITHKDEDEDEDENKNEQIKIYIEKQITEKTIEPEFVYYFLSNMDKNVGSDIECELDEDLFFLKKAFLKAYELFHYNGYNLKD